MNVGQEVEEFHPDACGNIVDKGVFRGFFLVFLKALHLAGCEERLLLEPVLVFL